MRNRKFTNNVAKPNSPVAGGATVRFWKDRFERVWFKILATTVYRRVLLLERTLNGPIPMISPQVDVTIDCLGDTQVKEYFQLQPEAQESEIHHRFSRGHTCFAARYKNRLIAVAWATPHRIHISYVAFVRPLPDKSIYFYESFTEPGYRGLSIQSALCSHMMRHYGAKGFQRVLTGVVPENGPSRRKNEKCGFRPFAMIRLVRFGTLLSIIASFFFSGRSGRQ
jgi:GNAT superfamily N-acetyltransferase